MAKKELVEELAAQMFYDAQGTAKNYEKLTEDEQKPWVTKAGKVLTGLNKMGKAVVDQVQLKVETDSQEKRLADLTHLIEGFVKKLDYPKNVGSFFPHGELAHKIIEAGL